MPDTGPAAAVSFWLGGRVELTSPGVSGSALHLSGTKKILTGKLWRVSGPASIALPWGNSGRQGLFLVVWEPQARHMDFHLGQGCVGWGGRFLSDTRMR